MKNLLVSKACGKPIKISIGNKVIGGNDIVIISGPCSIENYDNMMSIGRRLKEIGVDILRGGAFKPRTSPYEFQGLEYDGLKILKEVGNALNMPVISEIMDTRDVEPALDYVDVIQIGSRNMFNYSLLKEVGRTSKPVMLKRGMSATLKEWVNAAEYIMSLGNHNIILCERGIRTFENYTRNTLDLNCVAAIKNDYRLPVIVDPSHATGLRELVPAMSYGAIACGADGLMIESHIEPEKSISDSRQTISIDTLKKIISGVKKIRNIELFY